MEITLQHLPREPVENLWRARGPRGELKALAEGRKEEGLAKPMDVGNGQTLPLLLFLFTFCSTGVTPQVCSDGAQPLFGNDIPTAQRADVSL